MRVKPGNSKDIHGMVRGSLSSEMSVKSYQRTERGVKSIFELG